MDEEDEGVGKSYDNQEESRPDEDLSEENSLAVLEFAATSYAVLENEMYCRIIIRRYGNLDNDVNFKY